MTAGSRQDSDDVPVLDTAVLESLAEQLGEDIDGLVERFERRLAETAPAIERSVAAGDRTDLARQAHSLKSVAATFGAEAVARSSAELEAAGTTAAPADLEAGVEVLSRDCAAARSAVGAWLAARPGG